MPPPPRTRSFKLLQGCQENPARGAKLLYGACDRSGALVLLTRTPAGGCPYRACEFFATTFPTKLEEHIAPPHAVGLNGIWLFATVARRLGQTSVAFPPASLTSPSSSHRKPRFNVSR